MVSAENYRDSQFYYQGLAQGGFLLPPNRIPDLAPILTTPVVEAGGFLCASDGQHGGLRGERSRKNRAFVANQMLLPIPTGLTPQAA